MTTPPNPPAPQRPPRAGLSPRQSRPLGRLLIVLGRLGVAVAVTCSVFLERVGVVSGGLGFVLERAAVLSVLAVSCGGFGVWALWQGKRQLAPVLRSMEALGGEERVVLFLRSFADDIEFARRHGVANTEEEQLAGAVVGFGRMVALGRPGDRLPPSGAARHYASDHQWQSQVLAALDRASLVLLACGRGRSLQWEVEQIVARHQPERLVLVIGRDLARYESFAESFTGLFPKGLPDYQPRDVRGVPDTVYTRAVIWFDLDWTPHLRYLETPGREFYVGTATRGREFNDMKAVWVGIAFKVAIFPVLQRAGRPDLDLVPHARPWQLTTGVTAAVVGWLGTAWMAFDLVKHFPHNAIWVPAIPVAIAAFTLHQAWRRGRFARNWLTSLPAPGALFLLVFAYSAYCAGMQARCVDASLLAASLITSVVLSFSRPVNLWLQLPRNLRRTGTSESTSRG